MIIYGAGMAGLLAGNKLKRFKPTIHEAQKEMPDNHGALLRFRSDIASQATNLPFKKVNVEKAISCDGEVFDRPSMMHSNMYSQKVTGKVMGRSIKNLDPVERYIAPDDFIAQMAHGLNIEFDSPLQKEFLENRAQDKGILPPCISTVPMPIIMKMTDWKEMPKFDYHPIWSVCIEIVDPATDVYQTVYYPDPHDDKYRVSITGNKLIIEYNRCPSQNEIQRMRDHAVKILGRTFGIFAEELKIGEVKHQEYGKLLPIEDDYLRKEFILYLTDKYKVYSLGRFATWRQLLLDDIVVDVEKIGQMIDARSSYSRHMLHHGVGK